MPATGSPFQESGDPAGVLDCLVIGGGPAGLTAALYLARFRRHVLVVDCGSSRALAIPSSHNIPFFAEGIGGDGILTSMRASAERYGATRYAGTVVALHRREEGFLAIVETEGGASRTIRARTVLLTTGGSDVEPELPDLPDAIRRGMVRYCPICDGYEASGRRIAVLGRGDRGLGEALFLARTYSDDVTLLTLGKHLHLSQDQRDTVARLGIKVVPTPITELDVGDGRISALRSGDGKEYRFDVLYSALGMNLHSELATRLGARSDDAGALFVDGHNRTSVPHLYAAGDVVCGLSQIVVAMGQAAIAATDIHNSLS